MANTQDPLTGHSYIAIRAQVFSHNITAALLFEIPFLSRELKHTATTTKTSTFLSLWSHVQQLIQQYHRLRGEEGSEVLAGPPSVGFSACPLAREPLPVSF